MVVLKEIVEEDLQWHEAATDGKSKESEMEKETSKKS